MGKEKKTTYRRSPGDGGPVQALKKKKTKQNKQTSNKTAATKSKQ